MLKQGERAPEFSARDARGQMLDLDQWIRKGPVALFFLRYVGCTVCRLHMAQLQKDAHLFLDKNIQLAVVLESTPGRVAKYQAKKNLSLTLVPDLERNLYDLYQVSPGTLRACLAPGAFTGTLKASLKGHRHGAFEGHELQLPAAFLIGEDGKIERAFYGKHPADIPSAEELFGL